MTFQGYAANAKQTSPEEDRFQIGLNLHVMCYGVRIWPDLCYKKASIIYDTRHVLKMIADEDKLKNELE